MTSLIIANYCKRSPSLFKLNCYWFFDAGRSEKGNGFILVSANGGLNQQRVAVSIPLCISILLVNTKITVVTILLVMNLYFNS